MWNTIERRVSARLSTLGVVNKANIRAFTWGKLGEVFKETNEKNYLELRSKGKRIPLLWWRQIDRWERPSFGSYGPRKVKVRLDDVADESSHCDTAVFDF